MTRPKTVCLPSKKFAGAVVMKNWHPFVFGPEFACPVSFPRWVSKATHHGQKTWRVVLDLEVLIVELRTVDREGAGAVVSDEVSALTHELRDAAISLLKGNQLLRTHCH